MKKIVAVIVFAISALGFLCGLTREIRRSIFDSQESGVILMFISLFFMILSLGVILHLKKE